MVSSSQVGDAISLRWARALSIHETNTTRHTIANSNSISLDVEQQRAVLSTVTRPAARGPLGPVRSGDANGWLRQNALPPT